MTLFHVGRNVYRQSLAEIRVADETIRRQLQELIEINNAQAQRIAARIALSVVHIEQAAHELEEIGKAAKVAA